MNDILPFLLQHWMLSTAFVVILIAIIVVEARGKVGGAHKVTAEKAVHLMNRESAVVLDTRDRSNFEKGHIINAVNIMPSELTAENKQLEKLKNNPIIIVCASGSLSPNHAAKLHKLGYPHLHLLAGGMGAWKAANLPTRKGK
tara:strand:+ start:157348 stop:157776 length:429 start_codon:yes stop_codon:yes gene_type:complete